MGDAARAQFDDDEGEQRAEEEVGDREEVAGPDVGSVVAQGRRPGLPAATCRMGSAHVLLHRPRGHADGQLQEFAPDALRAPRGVLWWLLSSSAPFPGTQDTIWQGQSRG
jgi:hypothetical protein